VQKTVEEKIQAGEFPTRADITRAVKNVTAARVVEGLKSGKPRATVAKETGITERQVRRVAEQNNLGGRGTSEPAVDPATLSQTAQQKLNTAIKQHIRKLEEEFAKRVQQEVERRIGDLIGEYKDKYAMYQRIIMNRKGHMEESAYKNIRFCLHPDRVYSLQDSALTNRFQKGFTDFSNLEKILLDEKGSPTTFVDWPATREDWAAMKARKAQADAERRKKRNQ
jgi:hypothetical protein